MPDETAAQEPTEAELLAEFDSAIDEEEFGSYRGRVDEIYARFQDDVDRLRGELSDQADIVREVRGQVDELVMTPRVFLSLVFHAPGGRPFIGWVWGMPPISIGLLIAVNGWPEGPLWLVVAAMFLVTALVQAVIGSTSVRLHRLKQQIAQDRLRVAEGRYEQERARLVRESVRRRVTELFREAGIVTFPMLAPTLVELSTAKIAPSRTHVEVIDFIRSHETSAIGIAGARGAGKSTLMEAVRDADGLAGHHVLLTAPVRYEPLDFVRRLFGDVATEIVRKSGHPIETSHELHRRRFVRQRIARDVLTLGLLVMLTAVVFGWGLTAYDWTWDWRTTVGLAGAGVLAVVVSATALSLVRNVAGSADTRSALVDVPRSVRLAVEALEHLTWVREEGQKETGSSSLLGGLLTLGGEDNVTRKQRELSQPELVARFRATLAQFARDRPGERFVIFIDELDKLDHIDDLVNAINGIKDLLHLPGVHFVVSVSVDALVRFEERGMAARDAFDSAFDTVIRMRSLTLEESQSILASRAANFPAVLVLACHAWSGGLARDLLRAARRCVEIHRRSVEVVHVSEIMTRMVTEDMTMHIENAFRAGSADEVERLVRLRRAVRAVAGGADALVELHQLDESTSSQIDHVVRIGLALLGFVHNAPADWRWEFPPDDWNPRIEALAVAMEVRAEPVAIREEALRDAVELVSSTP